MSLFLRHNIIRYIYIHIIQSIPKYNANTTTLSTYAWKMKMTTKSPTLPGGPKKLTIFWQLLETQEKVFSKKVFILFDGGRV